METSLAIVFVITLILGEIINWRVSAARFRLLEQRQDALSDRLTILNLRTENPRSFDARLQ